ncbi:MAG: HAMP domain-containing sensor histidine kinase, partial [Candidatus Andersenbacteria bacterium]
TLIYAVILGVILIISSLIIYSYFSHRLEIRISHRLPVAPIYFTDDNMSFPDAARSDLALTLFAVNGVLFSGAIGLSYILAGITLRPIQDAYEKQRRFLSDASHELRTPLAILQTDLENELSEKSIRASEKERAESHLEEVTRMGSIVKDLLLISRLDRETTEVKKLELVNFSHIAQDVADRLTSYAEKNTISLISKLPELPVTINANTEHISQAITNLIKNSIDCNTKNGSVTLVMNIEKNIATLEIQDTGVGMSKKDVAKAFDRFYRVDESRTRATGGSGLGLSIVQSIAKTYNGTISLNSTKGKGTVAKLSFPLKEAP